MKPESIKPVASRIELERIRRLVKASYAISIGVRMEDVNEEREISAELIPQLLEDVGEKYLKLVIPMRSSPRHGWRISTVVGYIYQEQASFLPRILPQKTTAQ